MEKVKNFYEALLADKAMQERANQINEQYKGKDPAAKDENAMIAAIVEFAKGEGYEFTATELEEYQKEMRALPDDELDTVSGGNFPHFLDKGGSHKCYCNFAGDGKVNR